VVTRGPYGGLNRPLVRRSGLGAAAALAFLLAGCGGGSDGNTSGSAATHAKTTASAPHPTYHPCGRHELRDFRCGSISVPWEPRDASYGKTSIGFALRPADDRAAGRRSTPIVAVEGGPGYGSSRTAPAYSGLFGRLLSTHDLLLVDMRGTGMSEPIHCPDLNLGRGPDWLTTAQCAHKLGERFISYRTSAAADDVDSVRQALGLGKVALYGDSFGTFLGQSYAFRHPDTIRSLVLDSAYPARGESAWYPSIPRTGIRSYVISCERSPSCPPHARERLGRLTRHLRRNHYGAAPLLNALGSAGYGPPASYLKIDRAGRALMAGNPGPWRRLTVDQRPGSWHPEHYDHADEFTVGCNDYPLLWSKAASEPERRQQLMRAVASYPRDRFAPFTPREVAIASDFQYLECLAWPKPTKLYEPPISPGSKPTKAPVLIVSGELDDVTTPHEGHLVAQEFPDARQYIARNAGHVASLYDGHSPAAKRIRRFLTRNTASG
jgi:pimeloyl-ACP methyl ester carboxylesterase